MRYGRRRRNRNYPVIFAILAIPIIIVGAWWWRSTHTSSEKSGAPAVAPTLANVPPAKPEVSAAEQLAPAPRVERKLIAAEPDEKLDPKGSSKEPAKSSTPVQPASDRTVETRSAAGGSSATLPPNTGMRGDAIETAWKRFQSGDKIAARHELNALLTKATSMDEQRRAREYLSKIADEMIFSPARTANDPLVEEYVIQPGDALEKIGKKVGLPWELVASMNGITNPKSIRADQRLKIVRGPFNAKIVRHDFRMDLYVQDLYVRSYRVGLGADPGTPDGVWKVKEKLTNPTFFPPAGFKDKRIIAADDPKNPLGERWIGLEGVEGDAKGHEGYGIHGTIEPDSIGKAVSHGCVRMNNDDVAFVYSLMTPGQSMVTVGP